MRGLAHRTPPYYQALVAFCGVVALSGLLFAQSSDPKSAAAKPTAPAAKTDLIAKKDKPRAATAVTPEREAAVMTFVNLNHPELADLLLQLKENQPDEYDRAARDLFRTTERLAQIRDRDPALYDLELAVWTAQSHVQLLAAKLKMGDSDDLRKQLRAALLAQGEARVAALKHERKKTSDRLAKIEGDIARFEKDPDQMIDKQLEALTRAASEGRKAKVTAKSPAKQVKKSVTAP